MSNAEYFINSGKFLTAHFIKILSFPTKMSMQTSTIATFSFRAGTENPEGVKKLYQIFSSFPPF